jgi:hypothetical protein
MKPFINEKGQELKNWFIKYTTWKAYNAYTQEEAIEMFKSDGHKEDEIDEIE